MRVQANPFNTDKMLAGMSFPFTVPEDADHWDMHLLQE